MADLSDINAAQTVKIVGSDSIGLEQTPVESTSNGNLLVADFSNDGGVNGAITVTTSSIEAKVGGAPLSNRKSLTVFNNGSQTIYWGYTSGVTSSNGTPIFKNQFTIWSVGPGTSIYLISDSGSNDVRITENA